MEWNEPILVPAYHCCLKHLRRWPQGLLWNQSPKHTRILFVPFVLKGLPNQASDKHSWWVNIMSWLPGELWFALTKALWVWLKTRVSILVLFVLAFSVEDLDLGLDWGLLEGSVNWGICPWCRFLKGLDEMVTWPRWGAPGWWRKPRTFLEVICVWRIFQYFQRQFLI